MPQSNKNLSVVLVTRNHSAYIEQSIQSILGQTWRDFELIVINSGSTDDTLSKIEKFRDGRMRVITIENRGPGRAMNAGFEAASGKYVALLSGDDIAEPSRLEKQLAAAEANPGRAIFSRVSLIGDNGEPISTPRHLQILFDVDNASREQHFDRLLKKGNFLNPTTLFVPRELIEGLYRGSSRPFHPYLLQLQDLELFVRMLYRHDIWILPEPLMRYRVRAGGQNLSAPSMRIIHRSRVECFLFMSRFLESLPVEERARVRESLLQSGQSAFRLAAINDAFGSWEMNDEREELGLAVLLGDAKIFQSLPPDEEAGFTARSRYLLGRIAEEIRGMQ